MKVHAANIADCDGAKLLLGNLSRSFPRLTHLFADHGNTGPLTEWIKEWLHWETEIVSKQQKPSHTEWELVDGKPVKKPKPKGTFQIQRKRWVVERTFAWLTFYRRLCRDYELLPQSSESWIYACMIRLITRRGL